VATEALAPPEATATTVSGGRRMSLAVVSDAVHPFNTGGKEARYAALLPRMRGHGIDVAVYTMKWWPTGTQSTVDDVAMHAIAPLVPLYSGSRRSMRQALIFAVCSLRMLGRRFDVLEADAIPFVQLYPLWVVARLRRKRFVVTWHEVWGREYWQDYAGPVAGRVAARLEALAARLPDVVVATSPETAVRVRRLRGDRAGVVVVANGVDRAEIDAAPARTDVGDVVCVGRLLRHKNVHLVIEALTLLRAQGRELTLTVIGEGPERDDLVALAERLGVAQQVQVLPPFADRAEVLGAMKGARVVAFPTVREGFGMVALEALACGTPVVTADHVDNFARTLVVDGVNGRVCSAEAGPLAAALGDVLDHREAMAAACEASVDSYDWEQLAGRVAEVIRPGDRSRRE
jgi:glycosyltransferase involved in cell wall biosynthesis